MADNSASLRAMSLKCRRLANGINTRDVVERLTLMAEDYARQAEEAAVAEAAPAQRHPGPKA